MFTRIFERGENPGGAASPNEVFFASPRRMLLALAIGCFALFFLDTDKRDLWTPDEPRFGQISKEMLQDGNVFVLMRNGLPYSDKPPLYFYLACLAALVGGWLKGAAATVPSEWAMRLPSAAAALAGVFACYWIGLRTLNRRAAFFGAGAMALGWMYAWQGRTAQLDMLLSGFAFGSLACWVEAQFRPEPNRGLWLLGFYALAALSTLSKGPPGFIVPFGAALVFRAWDASPRRALASAAAWVAAVLALQFVAGNAESGRQPLMSPNAFFLLTGAIVAALAAGSAFAWRGLIARFHLARHLLGLALFAAIVLAWLIPMKLLSPESHSRDVLLGQTLIRYFNPEHHRGSMLFYYPSRLLADWMPWTLYLPAALLAMFRGPWAMPLQTRRFLLSWFLFTLVFFSLSPGKRDQYLLPCWPAIGLALGWAFDRALDGGEGLRRWFSIGNRAIGILFLILAAAAVAAHLTLVSRAVPIAALDAKILESGGEDALRLAAGVPAGVAAVPLFLGAAILLFMGRANPALSGFWGNAFASITLWIAAAVFLLPQVNPLKSGREFCDTIDRIWNPGEQVAMYNLGNEMYVYHGDYRVEEIENSRKLKLFFLRPGRQFAILRMKELDDTFGGKIGDTEVRIVAETFASGRHVVCVAEVAAPAASAASLTAAGPR